jgi:hypothetical protein
VNQTSFVGVLSINVGKQKDIRWITMTYDNNRLVERDEQTGQFKPKEIHERKKRYYLTDEEWEHIRDRRIRQRLSVAFAPAVRCPACYYKLED